MTGLRGTGNSPQTMPRERPKIVFCQACGRKVALWKGRVRVIRNGRADCPGVLQ